MSKTTNKPNNGTDKPAQKLLGKCEVCGVFPSIWRWFSNSFLCNDHANAKAKEWIKKTTEK